MNKLIETLDHENHSTPHEVQERFIKDLVSMSCDLIEVNLYLTRHNIYRARLMNNVYEGGYWIYTTTTDGKYFSLEYYKNFKQAINVMSNIIKTKEVDI